MPQRVKALAPRRAALRCSRLVLSKKCCGCSPEESAIALSAHCDRGPAPWLGVDSIPSLIPLSSRSLPCSPPQSDRTVIFLYSSSLAAIDSADAMNGSCVVSWTCDAAITSIGGMAGGEERMSDGWSGKLRRVALGSGRCCVLHGNVCFHADVPFGGALGRNGALPIFTS